MSTKVQEIIQFEDIQRKIYTIRRLQVMLDSDLAVLYGVETKRLNEQVERNTDRFPDEFMFRLTLNEYESIRSQNATIKAEVSLRSQIVTLENESLRSQIATLNNRGKHRKYLPYVFTEQGVSMLSAVLKSETAVKMSIQIMNAFVNLRRFVTSNAQIFNRLDSLETRQLQTENKLDQILDALESNEIQPKQGIFFDGQIFDAFKFISDLFRKAQKSIVIIDNYIDDTVLTHLIKRKKNVKVTILSNSISKQMELEIKKFSEQYPIIEIKEFKNFHDRFIIIDQKEVYHIGASLKDLGKKCFAFSKLENETFNLLELIKAY